MDERRPPRVSPCAAMSQRAGGVRQRRYRGVGRQVRRRAACCQSVPAWSTIPRRLLCRAQAHPRARLGRPRRDGPRTRHANGSSARASSRPTRWSSFATWVDDACAGRTPIFVGFNAPFDWMFVADYFWRYLGRNPFGISALDLKSYFMARDGVADWEQTRARQRRRCAGHRARPQPPRLGRRHGPGRASARRDCSERAALSRRTARSARVRRVRRRSPDTAGAARPPSRRDLRSRKTTVKMTATISGDERVHGHAVAERDEDHAEIDRVADIGVDAVDDERRRRRRAWASALTDSRKAADAREDEHGARGRSGRAQRDMASRAAGPSMSPRPRTPARDQDPDQDELDARPSRRRAGRAPAGCDDRCESRSRYASPVGTPRMLKPAST